MDLSCIISSGDLELYVLGLLQPKEAQQVEQLALIFPEIQQELDAISNTLEDAARSAAPVPFPAVKQRLMQKLHELKAEELLQASITEVDSESVNIRPSKAIPLTIPQPQTLKATPRFSYGMAASIIGMLLLAASLAWFAVQNRESKLELTSVHSRLDELNSIVAQQDRKLSTYTELMQYFEDKEWEPIRLMHTNADNPEAMAQVFWNKTTSEVMLSDISLPTTPAGKQYQLWAIVDGKPVDAGMLTGEKLQPKKMKNFATAQAFAITMEKEGGSLNPTMEAMMVMGKPSAS